MTDPVTPISNPTPPPTHDPTSSTTSSIRPARRGLSYLRSYTHHRLSSLTGSNADSSSPHALSAPAGSIDRANITPSLSLPPSDEGPAYDPISLADPTEEPLLPPNPFPSPLNTVRSTPAGPGDGPTASVVNTTISGITRIMARHRASSGSQNNRRSISETAVPTVNPNSHPNSIPNPPNGPSQELPSLRLVPHQDPRSSRPSLVFPPTSRTLPSEESIIRVGRYSERDTAPNPPPNVPSAAPVGFKSKVVSRKHCEFWCSNGQWFIKDVKSSSGTFLNHIRLSQPSVESRPYPVNDGDVVQLGIDFRGGEEMIFRCVKIRVECNRGWQKGLNNFNVATHKRLLGRGTPKKDTDTASAHSSECAICLMSIAPCQALFVAPCSHVWHYKCVRPILNDHRTWPSFLCPNCRAVADLDADLDDSSAMNNWDENGSQKSETGDAEAPTTDGASQQAATEALDHEDESLADMTSRQLSVRNGVDPPPDSVEYAGVDAPPPSRSAASPTTDHPNASTLLNRRNGRHASAPRQIPNPLTSEENLGSSPLSRDTFLRPFTPTQSLPSILGDEEVLRREAMMGDVVTPGSELGPMTPTNNAGPFVFDGSAGRDTNNAHTSSRPPAPEGQTETSSESSP